jgi:hypothetical protein
MKKSLIVLLSLIIACSAFSQSKKEQIETLTFQMDSLQRVIFKERATTKEKVGELEVEISVLIIEKEGIQKELSQLKSELIETRSNLLDVQNENEQLNSAYAEIQKECKELVFITNRSEIIDWNGDKMEFSYPYIEIPSNPFLEQKINQDVCLYTNLFWHYRSKYNYTGDMGFHELIRSLSSSKLDNLKSKFLGYTDQSSQRLSMDLINSSDKNLIHLLITISGESPNSIIGQISFSLSINLNDKESKNFYISTKYMEAHPDRGNG